MRTRCRGSFGLWPTPVEVHDRLATRQLEQGTSLSQRIYTGEGWLSWWSLPVSRLYALSTVVTTTEPFDIQGWVRTRAENLTLRKRH